MVKNRLPEQETQVQSLVQEDHMLQISKAHVPQRPKPMRPRARALQQEAAAAESVHQDREKPGRQRRPSTAKSN